MEARRLKISERVAESDARAGWNGGQDANMIDELKKLFAGKPGSCSLAFELISSEGAVRDFASRSAGAGDQDWFGLFASCVGRTLFNGGARVVLFGI